MHFYVGILILDSIYMETTTMQCKRVMFCLFDAVLLGRRQAPGRWLALGRRRAPGRLRAPGQVQAPGRVRAPSALGRAPGSTAPGSMA